MKAFLASITLALLFTLGTASAGTGESHSDGESGCGHYEKWKDT